MTSEFNPPKLFALCQVCSDEGNEESCYELNDVRFCTIGKKWMCQECFTTGRTYSEWKDAKKAHAVPDVPELVRYERTVAYEQQEHLGMVEHRYGDYVLYSQASEIIAAKDKEIERLKHLIDGDDCPDPDKIDALFRRAEAAEAKLEQYEAQKPFSYLEASLLIDQAFKTWAEKPHNRKWVKRIDGTPIPNDLCSVISERVAGLYASPAPAADLREENKRLRKAICKMGYAANIYLKDNSENNKALLTIEIGRAEDALKESSHDKG